MLRPSHLAAVIDSGSPLTVARPSRISTGFPSLERYGRVTREAPADLAQIGGSMSISTRSGDAGETATAGTSRVSKSDLRVEAYGTIDEVNSTIGVARAWCDDPQIVSFARSLQRDLFKIGSALSAKPESGATLPEIESAMIARLDAAIDGFEAQDGILRDWSISGELRSAAGFDLARTVARRAERSAVRLVTSGAVIEPNVLVYLNRLSDVLWLIARKLECDAGVDARLRDDAHPGPPWSRAW